MQVSQRSSIPAGWKLVPLEPTEKMLGAFWRSSMGKDLDDNVVIANAYKDLLQVVPEVPSSITSYFIVYDELGKIVEKFAFFSSLRKFLSENSGMNLTYKAFP